MPNIALALGGNLGDVRTTFSVAIEMLGNNGVSGIVRSSLYSNIAVGCIPGTPDFINSAIIGVWSKSPEELLNLIQFIEISLGRPRKHTSNTSRTLDIDIILFGHLIITTKKLTIPHPRARDRAFVLGPLNEIAPDWIFPDTGRTINAELDATQKGILCNVSPAKL